MDIYERLSARGYPRPCYWHKQGPTALLAVTCGQLVEFAADQYGDREALVSLYEGVRWTFKEAKDKADELAAGLLSLGLIPGDMIALWGYNSSYHYITTLASARAGLILAKVDPRNEAPELLHCLRKVGAKLLVAAETDQCQDYYQIVRSLAPELDSCAPGKLRSEQLPELTTLVLTGDQPRPGAYLFSEVMNMSTEDGKKKVKEIQKSVQPEEPMYLHYTSGTTGRPKAAVWTHHAAVNSSLSFGRELRHGDKAHRVLAQMQACHATTNLGVILVSLHYGDTMVIASPVFDPHQSILALTAERCTLAFGTPAIFVDLISKVQEIGAILEYPKIIFISGTTIGEVFARHVLKILPIERFASGYGMTEGGPLFCSGPEDTLEQSVLSAGTALPDVEFKVVDKEGKMVPMGMPGELWVRGYYITKGYWGDEDKTRETINVDRWLKTGDEVIISEEGRGTVVGRIKEAVIKGGSNIYPSEIEDFFASIPGIIDVQAFGVPDVRWGEEMCVFLRLREGVHYDEQDVRSYCQGKLAEFRIPRYIRFTNNFLRNTAGKVDKLTLKKQLLADKEFLENNDYATKKMLGVRQK